MILNTNTLFSIGLQYDCHRQKNDRKKEETRDTNKNDTRYRWFFTATRALQLYWYLHLFVCARLTTMCSVNERPAPDHSNITHLVCHASVTLIIVSMKNKTCLLFGMKCWQYTRLKQSQLEIDYTYGRNSRLKTKRSQLFNYGRPAYIIDSALSKWQNYCITHLYE